MTDKQFVNIIIGQVYVFGNHSQSFDGNTSTNTIIGQLSIKSLENLEFDRENMYHSSFPLILFNIANQFQCAIIMCALFF